MITKTNVATFILLSMTWALIDLELFPVAISKLLPLPCHQLAIDIDS
jgi:hypothetical protein